MKIIDVNLKIILDSRGEETLEAELKSDKFSASASVPAGKSKGAHEAFVLEPKKAPEKFESIKPQILNREFNTQEEFDNFLISLDGNPSTSSGQAKQNLGANLILALSLAFARLKAKSEEKELFQYINQLLRGSISLKLPRPIFNVINGGTHANNNLNFQEFQIIPAVSDFGMALGLGQEFYRKLKEFLEQKFGKENVVLGDEAGFSCPFKNNEETIEILAELIEKYHYPLRIGLDIAASQFCFHQWKQENYTYYLVDGKKYSPNELKKLYLKLIEAYKILLIEDPFYEEAFDDFAELNAELNKKSQSARRSASDPRLSSVDQRDSALIITDDLTTTNPQRLQTAIEKKAGNAILIKPNQIGTLTETLEVVQLAYENNWQAVVSHRSAETMDDFIADLAVGIAAWGIKAGAPAAPERLVKYERILKIATSH